MPAETTANYNIYHTIYHIANWTVAYRVFLAIFIVFLSLCAHFVFEFGFLPALPSLWIALLGFAFGSFRLCFVLSADTTTTTIIIIVRQRTGKARRAREKSGESTLLVVNKLLLVLLLFNSQRAITANLAQQLTLHYLGIPCNCAVQIQWWVLASFPSKLFSFNYATVLGIQYALLLSLKCWVQGPLLMCPILAVCRTVRPSVCSTLCARINVV